MKTEKIYQQDVYKVELEAGITDFRVTEKGCILALDKTIFFPTGGGQSCDRGTIGGFAVLDVYEKDDVIYHLVDVPVSEADNLNKGLAVHTAIDWAHRFDNMQRHCGEHILSGMFDREYGGVNRGFHMGENYMTIDISFEGRHSADGKLYNALDWNMCRHVELCANEAIWQNLPVVTRRFENRKAAEKLPLRKKLNVDEDISIVCVGDINNPSDCVACCGTHPSTSGQVGLIKLFKVEPNKGMFRVYFEAGKRALLDFDEKHDLLTELGNRFSAGTDDLLKKIEAREDHNSDTRAAYAKVRQALIQVRSREILEHMETAGLKVCSYAYDEFSIDDLRNLGKQLQPQLERDRVLLLADPATLTALLFSGGDANCSELIKANAPVFGGRGGGRPDSAQAKFDKWDDLVTFADALDKVLR